ncbi:MAG TPA: hypothetical protein VG943_00535 [Caulobacterales bacterium]|nr:hypothetical protein [Caulobacterales bacterium]
MQRPIGRAMIGVGAMAAACVGLAGCASAKPAANQPAWFTQALQQQSGGYPKLKDVPQTTTANTDQRHWAAVEADVVAAGRAMRANPRNQPVTSNDSQAFIDQARQDLNETAATHADTPPAAAAH